jgi:hypothetical protein
MPLVAPSQVRVHPNFVVPKNVITMAQASGFMMDLGGEAKWVYMNRVDIRTSVVGQQATANLLPSATITLEYAQTATYMLRTRNEYNEYDVQDAGEYNVALPAAYRVGARQGIYLAVRSANLFGFNASNSEGLLNVPNSTVVNLPPDTFGHTTLLTYDNGQIAMWLLSQIQAALQRMYALGAPTRMVFVGPQRLIGTLQMQNIVQTTSYQRPGAGTATSAQVVKRVADEFGITIDWAYDDTLQGQGGNASTDVLLLVMPEAVVPKVPGINTNEFGTLQPGMDKMTMQFANVVAPIEVTTPIVEGLDVTSSMRISSGWAPRGEAVTVLNVPYD